MASSRAIWASIIGRRVCDVAETWTFIWRERSFSYGGSCDLHLCREFLSCLGGQAIYPAAPHNLTNGFRLRAQRDDGGLPLAGGLQDGAVLLEVLPSLGPGGGRRQLLEVDLPAVVAVEVGLLRGFHLLQPHRQRQALLAKSVRIFVCIS